VGVTYGRSKFSLFDNGDFESGTNSNFTFSHIYTADAYRGAYSLLMQQNNQQVEGGQFISVDTNQHYRMTLRAKTIARSSPNNYLGYGHLGFICYDQSFNFIDLRNCGDVGNTTLTRACNPGDSYIYIASNSGWTTADDLFYFRNVLFYPPTHPLYSAPWKYTRIGFGDFNIYYNEIVDVSGNGTEYRLRLSSDGTVNMTMPDIGYSLPIGTPIARGVAGGSYNYIWVPDIPESWTLYDSGWFTGENRNSSLPFRYSTKYIKYMNLGNYARSETTSAKYLLDDIFLFQSPAAKAISIP